MDDNRRARFTEWFLQGPIQGDRRLLRERTGLTNGRITQLLDDKEDRRAAADRPVEPPDPG